jgi:hypothetical protein
MIAKKIFGHDHEILYDTIANHDVYDFLRVTLEVPRGQDKEAEVFLNGRLVGKVTVQREYFNKNGRSLFKTVGYEAVRNAGENSFTCMGTFKKLNKAVVAIITDFA